jgi:hypothetical protein
MSLLSRRALFWTPRVLSIVFILFLSMFSLDVFGENLGFWRTIQALAIHLIPSFVLIAALVLAWRWEWIGAALYGAAAVLYIIWVASVPAIVRPVVRVQWVLVIAGPAVVIAVLFLANWVKHSELRAPQDPQRLAS